MKPRPILLALLATACAANPAREPASAPDVDSAVSRVTALAASPLLTAQSCVDQLGAAESDFAAMDPASFDWARAEKAALKEQAGGWIRALFSARANLRERIPELVLGDAHDPCLRAIRRFLVAGREAEELFIESMDTFDLAREPEHDTAFSNRFPGTTVNPAFAPLKFLPGDVILDRGDAAESAVIARVAEVENLYSHTAVVGEDARGGLYVIETDAQNIVSATALKKYLHDRADVRMAIYRAKDQGVAKRAGRAMYEYVSHRVGKIAYDYAMDDSDPGAMYCSEVVQYAYRLGSQGKMILPRYKSDVSRFNRMREHNWLKHMGVPFDSVYAPADIDVDPRFTEVADYRSAYDIREHRRDDAVLSSMYDWMLEDDYYFPDRFGAHVLADLGEIKVRLFGDEMIPRSTPNKVLLTALVFQRVFDIVAANLKAVEDKHYQKTGHPLSFPELKKVNEAFRIQDCRLWQKDPGQGLKDAYSRNQRYVHESLRSSRACPALK